MAINVALLTTDFNDTALTSYTTASITPTAGQPVWLLVSARYGVAATEPPTPTITGAGLTWTLVIGNWFDTATTTAKQWLFHGHSATPTTEAVTINFGATMERCVWQAVQGTDVANPTAPNVQTPVTAGGATGTTMTATFAAALTGDAVVAFISKYNQQTLTAEAGYTVLGRATSAQHAVEGMWRADIVDNSPTWTSTSNDYWGITAIEIAEATGAAPQFARPDADLHVGNWTDEGAATVDLYQSIDEATASDADFVRSENTPASSVYVCSLGTVTDPGVDTDHTLRYRYDKEDVSGTPTVNLVVELRQGYVSEGTPGTLIASATHNGVTDALTDGTLTLTTGEAGNITDYADLAIRFVATQA